MAWVKVKWIPKLFEAFNTAFPGRGKASDGTIGDTAHQANTSGHNPDDTVGSKAERSDADSIPEVRAADVSSTLPGVKMYDVVQKILASSDKDRLIYIICDGWIWKKSNGWKREVYSGSDKHFGHAHFSGDPAFDEDSRPWNSILQFTKTSPGGGTTNMADSEFHTGAPNGPFLTQGTTGYAGQQRDTALAFTWQAATEAAAAAKAVLDTVRALATDLVQVKAELEVLKTKKCECSDGEGIHVGTAYVDIKPRSEDPSL